MVYARNREVYKKRSFNVHKDTPLVFNDKIF